MKNNYIVKLNFNNFFNLIKILKINEIKKIILDNKKLFKINYKIIKYLDNKFLDEELFFIIYNIFCIKSVFNAIVIKNKNYNLYKLILNNFLKNFTLKDELHYRNFDFEYINTFEKFVNIKDFFKILNKFKSENKKTIDLEKKHNVYLLETIFGINPKNKIINIFKIKTFFNIFKSNISIDFIINIIISIEEDILNNKNKYLLYNKII